MAIDPVSGTFRDALGWRDSPEETPAALVGVEQEYQVLAGGRPVDFRGLIHRLPVPGRRLDPGDLNAYRLESGLALTCDEAEAEVASPPIPGHPGFSAQVAAWAASGRAQLEALLPAGMVTAGYSTHLSASLPETLREPVLDLFLTRFAAALMLLLGCPEGYGLYLRPRPGRLEACGDHAGSHGLLAAAALLAGGVRACAAAVAAGRPDSLPPALALMTRPATGRFGLYLGRRLAFGFDLYAAGLAGSLPLAGGGRMSVAEYVALCRLSALAHLDTREPGLAVLEAILAGDLPLPAAVEPHLAPATPVQPYEAQGRGLLAPVERPRFRSRAVLATWDFAVFRLEGQRAGYCCVPRPALETFLDQLRLGRLDATVEAFLTAPPTGRRLQARHQALTPGLWDELGSPLGLLPDEPDPVSGSAGSPATKERLGKGARAGKVHGPARAGKPLAIRPGKPLISAIRPVAAPHLPTPPPGPKTPELPPLPPPPAGEAQGPEAPPPAPPRPLPPRTLAIAGAIAVVVAVVAVIAAAAGGVFQGPSAEEAATVTPVPAVSETAAPAATKVPETTGPAGPATGETTPSPPPPATETPKPGATSTPAVAPAGGETTPQATSTSPPVATATAVPTETQRPTASPTRAVPSPTPTCGPPGTVFACTPTPRPPTATPTRTPGIGPPIE